MTNKAKKIAVAAVAAILFFATASPYFSQAEGGGTEQETSTGTVEQGSASAAESLAAPAEEKAPAGESSTGKAEASSAATTLKQEISPAVVPAVYKPTTAKKKVAENSNYELFIDEKTGQIRLVDKRSGNEWGAPPVEKKMPPANQKFIESPVHIRYTEGGDVRQTFPAKEKGTITTIKPTEQGVLVQYELKELQIGFALEYKLLDEGIEVRIPFQSIHEQGKAKLISLEPVPFFGAAPQQSKGAMFIPDGSGALVKFKSNHPTYFEPYSEPIYGGDYAFMTTVYKQVTYNKSELESYGPREAAALPVFGIYKDDTAFLGVVTEGDTDAKINGTPTGLRNIPLYRISAELIYRNSDIVFIGGSGEIPLVQREMIPGDRAVRFVPLEGEQANYVGMAHAYRDYLVRVKGVKPVETKRPAFQLQLLGGVLRKDMIGSTFVSMTTFEQAKEILDGYAAAGIDSLEVTYEGWSNDGIYGNAPDHFPAESSLGGNRGLEALSDYAKAKGIRLYLKTNYVKPYESSDALKPSRDSIRGLNKEVMEVRDPWVTTNQPSWKLFYYLKPDRVYDKYIAEEAGKLAELGAGGIHLQYMGDTLYSDQSSDTPYNRKQTMETWTKAMDLMRSQTGHASVDYGFAYALGHVDRIDGVPMDSSHYVYEDGSVPFYQIAVRGLVPYTGDPSNLQDDPRVWNLRLLEYGAMPSYLLTYEDSSLLKRTMVDGLFSSNYSKWLKPSIDQYKKLTEVLNLVEGQEITDHEQLNTYVYRTTYGNGVQVTVNYDSEPARVGDDVIQPYDYLVRKG
ncbi:DUF5696 domain-containing protein [Paenibacillus terrigena]|uniref:DUF5696 domain-containing protein n=1 Tax=Paenibacillus terrigena TaxID=369333 RepID=UPI0028D8AEA1|nr:DUF5696 domain-containing protein [Paenibacillus terrigena]